jgi:hypothetical protein
MQILFYSKDLNATFTTIARSMSNSIRSGDSTQAQQKGSMGTLVVQYRIQWAWIALQCIWLLIGTVSLTATILMSGLKGAPVWKSSALAAMFMGSRVQGVLEGAKSLEELEHRAKLAHVRLFEPGDTIYSDIPSLRVESLRQSNTEDCGVSLLSSHSPV